jgi:hypothetical protein
VVTDPRRSVPWLAVVRACLLAAFSLPAVAMADCGAIGRTDYYTRAPRAAEQAPDDWQQGLILEAVVVRIVGKAATPADKGQEPSGYKVVVQRRLAGPRTIADAFVLHRTGACMFMDVPIGSRLVMGVVNPDAPNPSSDAVWQIVGDRVLPVSQRNFLDGDWVSAGRVTLEQTLQRRLGLPDTSVVPSAFPDGPQDRTWLLAITWVLSAVLLLRGRRVAKSATMHT